MPQLPAMRLGKETSLGLGRAGRSGSRRGHCVLILRKQPLTHFRGFFRPPARGVVPAASLDGLFEAGKEGFTGSAAFEVFLEFSAERIIQLVVQVVRKLREKLLTAPSSLISFV